MQLATLRDAERSKGVDFDSGSFTEKVKKTTSMLVPPLFANALSMADTMALAMESRAFGYSKNFTMIRPYQMQASDWLMVVLSVGGLAAVLFVSPYSSWGGRFRMRGADEVDKVVVCLGACAIDMMFTVDSFLNLMRWYLPKEM